MTTALITSNGLAFTPTGLEASTHVTFDQWLQAGLSFRSFVSTIDAAVAFCYGDWLNYGEDHFPDEYSQGLDVVLPINASELQVQPADKTIYEYKRLSREYPKEENWRGLPGLSKRHYIDAIRIKDKEARHEHLVQASVNSWSVRKAAEQLPPPRGGEVLPPTQADINFELEKKNYRLEHELAKRQALLDETASGISEARDILAGVVDDLPPFQAERVQQAIERLRPAVVDSELVELAVEVVRLYEAGAMGEMVAVIERLKEVLSTVQSARADSEIITVNGRVVNREQFFEK